MNILDELEEKLDQAHRYSDYIAALCCFHDDTRPSLLVYEDYYQCLSCGAKGKTKSLLDKLDHVIPQKPKFDFHNPFSRWMREQTLGQALKVAYQNGPSMYMRSRGIPDDLQKELGIGLRDGWITFPIRNRDHKIIGATARAGEFTTTPAKYVNPSDQDPSVLYIPSWERLEASRMVYLTFGIVDSITLHLHGLAAFSTTSGKHLFPQALDFLRKRIGIIPDRGEEFEAKELASKLGWRGTVIKVHWPEGTKDISDVWNKYPDLLVRYIDVLKD